MTHTEDVERTTQQDLIEFKNARIKALEERVTTLENKVEFLKAQVDIAKQVTFNKF